MGRAKKHVGREGLKREKNKKKRFILEAKEVRFKKERLSTQSKEIFY